MQPGMPPGAKPMDFTTGPLNYDESAQLMNDFSFRGKIKVACLKFASYINDEPSATPAHTTRYAWAQQTFQNPDNSATRIQPTVVMDPSVQTQGSSIPDTELQSAVETAVQKFL